MAFSSIQMFDMEIRHHVRRNTKRKQHRFFTPSFPSYSRILPFETNELPKPSLILSHRPCRTSALSSPLFQGSWNEKQLHTPSLLNLFSSLLASISQYLHALRSRLRSGRICAESVGAGSGLMGKLVEMREMGGEVISVVCKRTLFS